MSASSLDDLKISHTGIDTGRTDAVFGPIDDTRSRALAPLPPIRETRAREPGTVLHPAIFLDLDRPFTGAELALTYEAAHRALDGVSGWMPLAHTDAGWRDFVTGRNVTTSTRIACGVDLLDLTVLQYDVDQALADLASGCALIAETLGARVGPALDEGPYANARCR